MTAFIDVVNVHTKQIQTIPAEWLAHPVLGADFALKPSAKAAEKTAAKAADQTPATGEKE